MFKSSSVLSLGSVEMNIFVSRSAYLRAATKLLSRANIRLPSA